MAYGLREYGPRGRLKYGGAWGHLAGLSCALMSVVRHILWRRATTLSEGLHRTLSYYTAW